MEAEEPRTPSTTGVLIMSSDDNLYRILQIAFHEKGFSTQRACSSGECLDIVRKGGVEAVVLDLEFGGWPEPLLRHLVQEERRDSLVWALTSEMDDYEAHNTYGDLRAPIATKPLDPWHLVQTISERLRLRGKQLPGEETGGR